MNTHMVNTIVMKAIKETCFYTRDTQIKMNTQLPIWSQLPRQLIPRYGRLRQTYLQFPTKGSSLYTNAEVTAQQTFTAAG